jgi:hypothetical protein
MPAILTAVRQAPAEGRRRAGTDQIGPHFSHAMLQEALRLPAIHRVRAVAVFFAAQVI